MFGICNCGPASALVLTSIRAAQRLNFIGEQRDWKMHIAERRLRVLAFKTVLYETGLIRKQPHQTGANYQVVMVVTDTITLSCPNI